LAASDSGTLAPTFTHAWVDGRLGYADALAATGDGTLLRSLGPADRADVLMACATPPPTAVALLLRTLPFLDPARLRRLCQYARGDELFAHLWR
jgi:hypothetical protein